MSEKTLYETYSNVQVSPLPKDMYIVTKSFTLNGVNVREGFTTDGATIPRILWVFWPPNRSTYLPAVIVHDFQLKGYTTNKQFKVANIKFKQNLELLDVDGITVFLFYLGVETHRLINYLIIPKIKNFLNINN